VYDVAVIGGGIVGTSAAAFLAEAGASVVLFEASALGAGASGRNSGAIQHPYDPPLAELYRQTLPLYRELAQLEPDFELPLEPTGLLVVSTDEPAAEAASIGLRSTTPELESRFINASEMRSLEPALAAGVAGCLLATGYAVVPAGATLAYGRRALRAGAELRLGALAQPRFDGDRAVGVQLPSGESVTAGSVLLAAGPWSVGLVPGWAERPPIGRTWGLVATIALPEPPARILEELSIDARGSVEPHAFSLITADGASSLGSTFLPDEPDAATTVRDLVARGRRFVPAVADALVLGVRICARPIAFDGRPLVGRVNGVERLYVCAGHGPWGISTGPASARLVVDAILGRGDAWPPELAASRY
jgi:glycine/D-amino acid oxidase-like deaminating enzyme